MASRHAAAQVSNVAKFFPAEVYPVAAPVAVAGALFAYMVTRTITADPDTRLRANMPLDCKTSTAYGEEWRNTIRGFFASRIEAGHITIFDNGPMAIRR
ncbi:hypothetical protein COO60DRAFT_1641835 [Scenedesmus sp. NREL 46B-D3]|nr:hypothetical protein COO60DRAFT_1641835 [Scenedesmus sp. NREL 46B-D3]